MFISTKNGYIIDAYNALIANWYSFDNTASNNVVIETINTTNPESRFSTFVNKTVRPLVPPATILAGLMK